MNVLQSRLDLCVGMSMFSSGVSGTESKKKSNMCKLADIWPERGIVQRTVAQIPWRSNLTLRGFSSPMDIAEWETSLTETLPDDLKGSLPTIKEIEAELMLDEEGAT